MGLEDDRQSVSAPPAGFDLARWIVPLAVVAVVALRLPYLNRPPTTDESGYLLIGAQWHAGGTSLYGDYWVDRPPGLLALFQLSSVLGGVPAVHVMGCVAVGLLVLGSSFAAGLIAGPRAARWSAVVAAALCTTPLLGTDAVNGEILASPFIVWSIVATLAAFRSTDERRAVLFAIAAGAGAMCGLLVKQNLADAFVFGLVATIVAWRLGDISERRCFRILVSAGGGTIVALAAIATLTLMRGTSLPDAFNAMYTFRLEAGRVIAAGGSRGAALRLHGLLTVSVASGLAFLVVMVIWGAVSRRLRGAAAIGLSATLLFDALSIAMGGNYWSHYLVELFTPIAILTGVLISRHQPLLRPLVAATVVVSAVAWTTSHANARPSGTAAVGYSIAASAHRGDTIVIAYGHPEIVKDSGLSSPYPYLWTLPIKTLDPQLRAFNTVLTGPKAPTWLVIWNNLQSWGLNVKTVSATVRRDYRFVGRLCGHRVYLHRGVTRAKLRAQNPCRLASTLSAP